MSTQTAPRSDGIVPEVTEYDVLLTAIPLPLLGSLLAGLSGLTSLATAVGAGGLASVALVVYALFVAAPGDDEPAVPDATADAGRPADD